MKTKMALILMAITIQTLSGCRTGPGSQNRPANSRQDQWEYSLCDVIGDASQMDQNLRKLATEGWAVDRWASVGAGGRLVMRRARGDHSPANIEYEVRDYRGWTTSPQMKTVVSDDLSKMGADGWTICTTIDTGNGQLPFFLLERPLK